VRNVEVLSVDETREVCVQITGVMTQGRGGADEWVTSFMMSHSLDAFNWQYVRDLYDNQRVRYVTLRYLLITSTNSL